MIDTTTETTTSTAINNFKRRFGREYFRRIPEGPGVYWMLDSRRKILFVGKSKNLRKRLTAFKYADLSKKNSRQKTLINLVHDIQWQGCALPEATRVEVRLLREHRPQFNQVIRPNQAYIGYSCNQKLVTLFLLKKPPTAKNLNAIGVFAIEPVATEAFASLLRIFWQVSHKSFPNPYPTPLTRKNVPSVFRFQFSNEGSAGWILALSDFMEGRNDHLLRKLSLRIEREKSCGLDPFYMNWLEKDLENLYKLHSSRSKLP